MTDTAPEQTRIPYSPSALPVAREVLVFAPHADDEVFGCGGTLALLVAAGASVRVVVVTDGALGGVENGPGLISLRQSESAAAALVLGYPEPENWALPDRGIRYGEALVRRMLAEMGNADLVFAPHPGELHPDHQVVALACFEALQRQASSARLAFYEVSSPLEPNTLIDITVVAEAKLAAMRCFASQLAEQRYDERMVALNCYRTYTLPRAVQAAEAFRLIESHELGLGLPRLCPDSSSLRIANGLAIAGSELPLISILVLCTGRPELESAIASIRQQTYPNLELVLIYVGEGKAWQLPETYGRFLMTPVNFGKDILTLGAAVNRGLAEAQGEYLGILDEDALLLPDHVEKLFKALCLDQAALAGYSGVHVLGRDDAVLQTIDEAFDFIHPNHSNPLPLHAILFRRAAIDTYSCRFDEASDCFADRDFLARLAGFGSFNYYAGVSVLCRRLPRASCSTESPLQPTLIVNPPAGSNARSPLRHLWVRLCRCFQLRR